MGRLDVQAALEYTNISWSLPLNYPTMLNPSYMLLALPAYCRKHPLGTLPHPRPCPSSEKCRGKKLPGADSAFIKPELRTFDPLSVQRKKTSDNNLWWFNLIDSLYPYKEENMWIHSDSYSWWWDLLRIFSESLYHGQLPTSSIFQPGPPELALLEDHLRQLQVINTDMWLITSGEIKSKSGHTWETWKTTQQNQSGCSIGIGNNEMITDFTICCRR